MISIKTGDERDLETVAKIAAITWQPTYVPIIGQQQVDYMLASMYSQEELLRQFNEGHTFLLAMQDGRAVGFAGFSVVDADAQLFKLHKLYVLPETHGLGIGKLLIDEVGARARQQGGRRLELNVNRKNKAYDFYLKQGFTVRETTDIDIGGGYFMNDYIMEKAL